MCAAVSGGRKLLFNDFFHDHDDHDNGAFCKLSSPCFARHTSPTRSLVNKPVSMLYCVALWVAALGLRPSLLSEQHGCVCTIHYTLALSDARFA